MKTITVSPSFGFSALMRPRRIPLWAVAACLLLCGGGINCAAAEDFERGGAFSVYEKPKLLNGAVYASEDGSNKLLYKFTRSATRSGSTVRVQRDYTYPDGKPAAREVITYEGNALVSFELEELQIGAIGSARIRREGGNPNKAVIEFSYTKEPGAKPKVRTENLAENTLNSDMIATFLASHWDKLVLGEKVEDSLPCRATNRDGGLHVC